MICPNCHHKAGQGIGEYGATCYCNCHAIAEFAPEMLEMLSQVKLSMELNSRTGSVLYKPLCALIAKIQGVLK